jgi:hypothetical protein
MHFVNHNLWKKKKTGEWRKEEFVFSERVGDRRPEDRFVRSGLGSL